ncbi:MAG: ankyrin repeat domain-containing protein [Proteobacteria bacterium]|jgi:ankyrin repeat protein|nr:ankyrin repeat domain-containing protein [Pseudomonadota bacterium]
MDVNADLSELLCTMLRADRREVAQAILMEPDIDVNHRSSGGQTPLHIAAGLFLHGLAAVLLVKGADPNARDQRGRTPLMNAARAGDTRTASQLLKHGANPDLATTRFRWTALMWASRYQRTGLLKQLLDAGADPALRDLKERSAADIARQYHGNAALRLLEPETTMAPP